MLNHQEAERNPSKILLDLSSIGCQERHGERQVVSFAFNTRGRYISSDRVDMTDGGLEN